MREKLYETGAYLHFHISSDSSIAAGDLREQSACKPFRLGNADKFYYMFYVINLIRCRNVASKIRKDWKRW